MGKVGFVGLGTMGAPMSGHLVKAGHDVVVWNRTPEKAEPLAAQGASVATNLATLAEACDTVILCVNRSEDVAEVVSAIVPKARAGTLIVDHSTIAPSDAIALHHKLESSGLHFVDAPITGGSMGAINGTLTIFCGGTEDNFNRAAPILNAYARRVEQVGGPGAGQMMKMANQIAVGGALLALCESLAFAERVGLDLRQAHAMIGSGAAGSWAFENYGPKILNRDWSPGFSIKNQRKDFGYALQSAETAEALVPGTILVDELLSVLEDEGRGEETTAALFDLMVRGSIP